MAVGDFRGLGTGTVPAGAPGEYGEVDVAVAGLLTTDIVVGTMCHTALQDASRIKRDDITFQLIKSAGSVKIRANQKQNPSFIVDIIAFEGA